MVKIKEIPFLLPRAQIPQRGYWPVFWVGTRPHIWISPYCDSQATSMRFHHPFHIHLSSASKVQYIMYPTLSSSTPLPGLNTRPNMGRDINYLINPGVLSILREHPKCNCNLSYKYMASDMTWNQI